MAVAAAQRPRLRVACEDGRESDVVYATGLTAIVVSAGRLIRRPVIVKVAGDPAWERDPGAV